jgi:hypothetical protein
LERVKLGTATVMVNDVEAVRVPLVPVNVAE